MAKAYEPKKTECKIKRTHFLKEGGTKKFVIDGQEILAEAREFSSGSFGYFTNGKVTIEVDGIPVKCQLSISLVVVGSKDVK